MPGDRAMASAFRAIFFSFILLSSLAAPVAAGPLEDATAALERRDLATAFRLLRPLADQGNAEAQMKLGFMYVTGEGTPQDYVEALKWFRLAADQGQANAQCFLGLMYFEGRGVPQDYVSAHMWLDLAAAAGIEDAAEYRHALTAKMTPAQISEAQRLARKWKPGQKYQSSLLPGPSPICPYSRLETSIKYQDFLSPSPYRRVVLSALVAPLSFVSSRVTRARAHRSGTPG
jgi:uncharacterized protein